MTIAPRLNLSKIIQLSVLGAIAIFISSTAYATDSQSGVITSEHLTTQNTNNKIGKIDTRIATREAKLTLKIDDWKAKMASREAALKLRLETFKDKQKADIAQRVSNNLNLINQRETDHMLKNLDSMTKILDKLEAGLNNNITNINNPDEARTIIANARETIATTSAAVTAQSQKDYTIQVSTELRIKIDALAKRNLLHKDLEAIRKDMIDTKQSIFKVLRIARIDIRGKEGSNSATNN